MHIAISACIHLILGYVVHRLQLYNNNNNNNNNNNEKKMEKSGIFTVL